uniref:A kinase-anchoring proteins AKAP-5 and AKAP-12 calmodulin (CaM)-binding domain-containing protein n=1 Tax=Leptobrachium leishanense TaxID=445787 RepID=A0A8C5QTK8_9ANUR
PDTSYGTFAIERKSSLELNPEKSDLGTTKKSKKCQKKGHRAYKPLKICFKKRSKNIRTKSDSNDDNKPESKSCVALCEKEVGCSPHNESTSKTWVNFKKMVTRRRKLHSSLKKQPNQTCQHLEASTDVTCSQCASNKNRFAKLKIPCMTFSRRKKSLESIVPAEETSEMQAAEPGTESDCERSDKVLAIKYKLQRSLNAENREIGIDGAQSTFSPKDERQPLTKQKNCMDEAIIHKEQNISNGVYGCHSEERQMVLRSDQLKEDSLMISNCTELTSVPVPENMSSKSTTQFCAGDHQDQGPISSSLGAYTSPDDSHTEQIKEKPDAASLSNVFHSKNRSNNLSLINDISNLSIVIPDPYEIMLMTTATSLVKKVIQSSIQQLVDEGTFLNHVPANLLSRSTF